MSNNWIQNMNKCVGPASWDADKQTNREIMKTPIDQAVDRFLPWKLPRDFNPDCGISFKRESDYDHPEFGRTKFEPTGTNLLTADQAKAMLEQVCEPLLTALAKRDAEIDRLRELAQRPAKHEEEHAMIAWKLAGQLLKQAQAQDEVCAYWFVSALSKLASSHPKRPIVEVLALAMNAMPTAAKQYRDYVADKF